MTDVFHLGVGWNIAEVTVAKQVYGVQNGTGIAIASNVCDLVHGTYLNPGSSFQNRPTTLSEGNLMAQEKVGTQDWGGSVGDSEYFYFGHGTGLKFKMSSASGWKIMATNNGGTEVAVGTTEYAWASSANVNAISLLRTSDRIRVQVNGVEEIDVSGVDSAGWDNNTITQLGSTVAHATKHMYLGRILRESTDVAGRYLDPAGMTFAFKYPTGAGTDVGFTTNNADDVDDYGVSPFQMDGDTTNNLDVGTKDLTFRTSNATDDFTLADALGADHYSIARGNVAAKNTTGMAMLRDGSVRVEAGTTTYPDATSYLPMTVSFPTAPGGGAWSAFTMNNLEVGFRHDVGPLADAIVLTAMAVELFGCTFASDPATAARKSLNINQSVKRAAYY